MKIAEKLIAKVLKEVGIKEYSLNTLSKQTRALNSIK